MSAIRRLIVALGIVPGVLFHVTDPAVNAAVAAFHAAV